MWEINDLVEYRPYGGTPVKGRIVDIIHDVTSSYMIFRVSSKNHRVYSTGYEYQFDLDSPRLFKRKRRPSEARNHG